MGVSLRTVKIFLEQHWKRRGSWKSPYTVYLSNSQGSKENTTLMFREKCAGTVKAKPGEEELLEAFWKANYYVAGMIWRCEETKLYRQCCVADLECVSLILIFILPGSRIQKSNKIVPTFFVATNIINFELILLLNWWWKKCGPIYKEYKSFLPKIVIKLSKIWFGIRDPEKTCSGSKGQKGTRIPDPDPQHCWQESLNGWSPVRGCRSCLQYRSLVVDLDPFFAWTVNPDQTVRYRYLVDLYQAFHKVRTPSI